LDTRNERWVDGLDTTIGFNSSQCTWEKVVGRIVMKVVIKHASGQLKTILEGIQNGEEVLVELEGHTFIAVPKASKHMVRLPDSTSNDDSISMLEKSDADDWKYWMENPVDFVELTQVLQKVVEFCSALCEATSILFDPADEFKPRLRSSGFSQSFSTARIDFRFGLADGNSRTNPHVDYWFFECNFCVVRRNGFFSVEIVMNNIKGNISTNFDDDDFPVIEPIEISKDNWHDLNRRVNSDFRKISIGRSWLQFLLRDFYSEDRYQQFKKEARSRLQKFSLENLIQD
jgi:hypothetical protein